MMYVNRTPAPATAKINLSELAEVRQYHMPCAQVRFAKPCQLVRVAGEISRQYPRLREEAEFVVVDELNRRAQLAESPLTIQ